MKAEMARMSANHLAVWRNSGAPCQWRVCFVAVARSALFVFVAVEMSAVVPAAATRTVVAAAIFQMCLGVIMVIIREPAEPAEPAAPAAEDGVKE